MAMAMAMADVNKLIVFSSLLLFFFFFILFPVLSPRQLVVEAHTFLDHVTINGQDLTACVRDHNTALNSPLYDTTAPNIVCNAGVNPKPPCAVKAGDTINLQWYFVPQNRFGAPGFIDKSHKGPYSVYMAKVDERTSSSSSSSSPSPSSLNKLQWFKIHAHCYDTTTKQWGVDELRANSGAMRVRIPPTLPRGYYIIRGEIVALHQGFSFKGAQYYVHCVDLFVHAVNQNPLQQQQQQQQQGLATLPRGILIPGPDYIHASDPGVYFNIYTGDLSTYRCPGPPLADFSSAVRSQSQSRQPVVVPLFSPPNGIRRGGDFGGQMSGGGMYRPAPPLPVFPAKTVGTYADINQKSIDDSAMAGGGGAASSSGSSSSIRAARDRSSGAAIAGGRSRTRANRNERTGNRDTLPSAALRSDPGPSSSAASAINSRHPADLSGGKPVCRDSPQLNDIGSELGNPTAAMAKGPSSKLQAQGEPQATKGQPPPPPPPPRQSQGQQSLPLRLGLTTIAATVAEIFTFPIDITKTRLQLDGEMQKQTGAVKRRGALGTALGIAREEGVSGLYRGLSAALVRHMIYSSSRIVIYEQLRAASMNKTLSSTGEQGRAKELSVGMKALLGGTAGVIGQVIASPADLVKVRMQADGRLAATGVPPRYTGFRDACSKIYGEEGLRGLWRGVGPNAQRAAFVNMGELACYDHVKYFIISRKLADDNIAAHTMASVLSGLSATVLSCPADVVKTRMMNQGHVGSHQYSSSVDCLVKTVRAEGVLALWKGFFPTWARLGPWQFVFWVSYEHLRKLTGLSSF
ncbi:hypothetical protein CBR_g51827 [Chara braunii]|uniref:Auxiliary Activity family 9 catalytic domain-containing protein n=1 Tax=Chara braunii TaxID=69332 RepID=A0A388M9D9_CHABU|nr:hypothetical protein CBR_g51827 [Chara braunii]|eukprot:GBG91093.1 hypothetical protein CBR_g51827 [Chara braunii]